MKKLFLIAGHNVNDPGAVSTVKEADLTVELRDLIIQSLLAHNSSMVIVKDSDKDSLAQVIARINGQISEADILIDIHFNSSGNPKATGAEVLVKTGSEADIVKNAVILSATIAKQLEIKDRGVKTEKDAARPRIGILHGAGDRYLLEICFISNPTDLQSYQKNKFVLANAIAEDIEGLLK